jgi:hypothetical protein
MAHKVLLFCGILAALLYLAADLLAGKFLKGYSFSAHSMSDLSASGAPTRSLVMGLTLAASALMVAFGIGVWRAAGPEILPRIVAVLILGNAAAGLVAMLFFPNQLGVRPIFGSPGVLLMFASVLSFVLAMAFGAAAFHGWMRLVSIAIPVSYVLLAVLRFATAASSKAGSEVLIGTQERTMAYSFLVWVVLLAIYHLLLESQIPNH